MNRFEVLSKVAATLPHTEAQLRERMYCHLLERGSEGENVAAFDNIIIGRYTDYILDYLQNGDYRTAMTEICKDYHALSSFMRCFDIFSNDADEVRKLIKEYFADIHLLNDYWVTRTDILKQVVHEYLTEALKAPEKPFKECVLASTLDFMRFSWAANNATALDVNADTWNLPEPTDIDGITFKGDGVNVYQHFDLVGIANETEDPSEVLMGLLKGFADRMSETTILPKESK